MSANLEAFAAQASFTLRGRNTDVLTCIASQMLFCSAVKRNGAL